MRVWFAALVLTACSRFDAGTLADAGTPSDAAPDGGLTDAGPSATVEAGLPDAGAPCFFCASFEPPNDVAPFGFNESFGTGFELSPGVGISSSNALHLHAGKDDSRQGLTLDFGPGLRSIQVGLQLKVTETPPSSTDANDAVLVRIACNGGDSLDLKVKRTGTQLQLQHQEGQNVVPIQPNAWTDVGLSWDLVSGNATATAGAVNGGVVAAVGACSLGSTVSIGWVDLGNQTGDAYDALVDDVRIDPTF